MKLCVERSGTGPPLVLWHGWGLNLRVFDELRAELASEFELIAVDLPGHGAAVARGHGRRAQLGVAAKCARRGAASRLVARRQFALRARCAHPRRSVA